MSRESENRSEGNAQEQLKGVRLSRIFDKQSGNTVIAALDDSSISGPENRLRDMQKAISTATDNGTNAVLGFYGMFEAYRESFGTTAGILNITLSTEGPHHLRKIAIGTIEDVKLLDCLAGVSVHVNTTSPREPEMLEILGQTASSCRNAGIPLLAHVYPRTITNGKEDHYDALKKENPEAYAKLVRHGARIAADLGADIIKVPFTGDAESFKTVVESTYGKPVVMAGGPMIEVSEFLGNAHTAIKSGARGIAVGRNYFQRPTIEQAKLVLLALGKIVHKDAKTDEAMEFAESESGRRQMPGFT